MLIPAADSGAMELVFAGILSVGLSPFDENFSIMFQGP